MSAGGVYIANNNDGTMDELLYMTAVLQRRLSKIREQRMAERQARMAAGQSVADYSSTPTLADVAASHILLPYKTYKPYVVTTFQYLKNRISTGNISLSSEATFPQQMFGEFIADSMLHIRTSSMTCATKDLRQMVVDDQTLLPPNTADGVAVVDLNAARGTITAGGPNVTAIVHTIEDALGNVLLERAKLTPTTTIALSDLTTAGYTSAITVRDYVQYADFPILAMISKVQFQITNNDIDSYTNERDNFHLLYTLPTDKRAAYYKCVCQELPLTGYSDLMTNYTVPGSTIPGYSAGNVISARQQVNMTSGYQTPKVTQPGLDGMYPNAFDHCRRFENSIPVLAIPNTERTYLYTFASQDKIVFSTPANLFKVTTTYVLSAGSAVGEIKRVDVSTVRTPITVGGGFSAAMTISGADLYVNNIFIDPSIHDIYLERIGFILTRVNRTQVFNINAASSELTLNSFKWPLEFMFIGLRPSTNTTTNAQRNWYKFGYQTEMLANYNVSNYTPFTGADGAADYTVSAHSVASAGRITYDLPYPTIDTLKVSLQTITLYDSYKAQFYNGYLPYAFGGSNIVSTPETSTLFVTFSFCPNTDGSPLGHVNISRSREFTITYSSSVIGSGNLVQNGSLVCVGTVINFLLVSAGNLYLRFT